MNEANQFSIAIITSLRNELSKVIEQQATDDEVCIFLSGGADSTTVALAANYLGKKITAISYQLGNNKNEDCEIAERTCAAMGWQFHKVIVPTEDVSGWFLKLINGYECDKKTEVEVLYPVIFMIERAKSLGFSKVLTGFGSPLPHSARNNISAQKDMAAYWQRMMSEGGDISTATSRCITSAKNDDIEILMPFTDSNFIKCLTPITHNQLNKPYPKAPYRLMYEEDFKRLGLLKNQFVNLQKGGGVDTHFAQVLNDENINIPNYMKGGQTKRIVSLVQYWVKKREKEKQQKDYRFSSRLETNEMQKLVFHPDIQRMLYYRDNLLKFYRMKIQDGHLYFCNDKNTILTRIKIDTKQKAKLDGQQVPKDFEALIDTASAWCPTPSSRPKVTFYIDRGHLTSVSLLNHKDIGFTADTDWYDKPELSYMRGPFWNPIDLSKDPIAKKKVDDRYEKAFKKWNEDRREKYFRILEDKKSSPNRLVELFDTLTNMPIENYYIHRLEGLQNKAIKKFKLNEIYLSPDKISIGKDGSDIMLNHNLNEPTNMHFNFQANLENFLKITGDLPYDLIIPQFADGKIRFAYLKQVGFPFAESIISISQGSGLSKEEFLQRKPLHERNPDEEFEGLTFFYEE